MNKVKKVLFVATVVKTHINVFHIPYLKLFKENNYETSVCAQNDFPDKEDCIIPYCDYFYDIPFSRNPFGIKNIKCFFLLRKIIKENNFDIIHCHTPVGGVITRLAAKSLIRNNAKIIYTAHGFHFYSGGPLFNWFCYYPIEKWLARFTDILITINEEDYLRAQKFKAKHVVYVPGVGIKIPSKVDGQLGLSDIKRELNLSQNDIVLLSVGELIKRKNHSTVITAIAEAHNKSIKYFICGDGIFREELSSLIYHLSLEKQVFLLGFRRDILELCKIADIFILPSLQEGLSVALMEAMASGLPVIASNIRGNNDLIKNELGGVLVPPSSINAYISAIDKLTENEALRKAMGNYNLKVIQDFSIDNILKKMKEIYSL